MNKQYINIAIAGLNIQDSAELKNQLCNIMPDNLIIHWKKASDLHLDCLFIHETFFNTDGMQKLLNRTSFPWLKISKDAQLSSTVQNNTLYFPLLNAKELYRWLEQHIMQSLPASQNASSAPMPPEAAENQIAPKHAQPLNERFFKQMLTGAPPSKLHLYDDQGSIAVIDVAQNSVWPNPHRLHPVTDLSFKYDLASTTDLAKADRKESAILQDWLWNLFWNSPDFYQIAPEDGHYRIHFWPKPADKAQRKKIFQLSACFIQGAKLSKISEQHGIPIRTIQQFIAANIAVNNISKINLWDAHYSPPKQTESSADKGFIQGFIGKLRKKFGF